ncbi:unnamed protein product, partial [Bubo scandiacus]
CRVPICVALCPHLPAIWVKSAVPQGCNQHMVMEMLGKTQEADKPPLDPLGWTTIAPRKPRTSLKAWVVLR